MIDLKVDVDLCVGCGECAATCPYLIIRMDDVGAPRAEAVRERMCIGCGHCMAICPTAALSVLGRDPAEGRDLAGAFPDPLRLETLFAGRRSVRRFLPEPVDSETVARLLEASCHAPTGKNNGKVLFTVIEDPTVMADLRARTLDGLRDLAGRGAMPRGMEAFTGYVHAWDSRGADVIFRRAPQLLVASSPAKGPSPLADCHIALTHFDLLASCMGLGTLWNGMIVRCVAALPDLQGALGIPEDHVFGYAVLFGRPAVAFRRTVPRGPARVNRVSALKG